MTTRSILMVLLAITSLTLPGCMTPQPIPGANPDLLGFLQPGKTSLDQVLLTLGQPSATFENERIITYRIGKEATQGYFIVNPKPLIAINPAYSPASWLYSLVLVFDQQGLLEKQKLVPVNQ